MKNLIAITLILSALTLTSCQDCRDCQSTSTLNLNIEYFVLDNNEVYQINTTDSYTYSGIGAVASDLLLADSSSIEFANAISPVLTQEFCGQDLKDYNNTTFSYEQISGDTIGGLFKYSWTEEWDCQ